MPNTLLRIVAAACFVVAACSAEKGPPPPYENKAGRYAVWFPTAPFKPALPNGNALFQTLAVDPSLAHIMAARPATASDSNLVYSVAYGDAQAPVLHSDSIVFMQEALRSTQFLMADSARLLSQTPVLVHGYRGTDYVWQSHFRRLMPPGILVRTRVLLVKKRLYALSVSGKGPNSASATRFFNSFRLLNTPSGQPPVVRYKVPGNPAEIIETRYPDGTAATTRQVLTGTLERPAETIIRRYDPSGRLDSETRFNSGRRHGLARAWYPTGGLSAENFFRNDTLITSKAYYVSGKPEYIWNDAGQPDSKPVFYSPDGTQPRSVEEYAKTLLHPAVPPWSVAQLAQARARCLARNAARNAPAVCCDCCLQRIKRYVRAADFLSLGTYGEQALLDAAGIADCGPY